MTHSPTYLANQNKHQTEQHPTYHQRQPQANEQPLLPLPVAYNGSFKGQNPFPLLRNQHLATLADFIIMPLKKFTLASNLTPKSQIKPIISSTKIMKNNNKQYQQNTTLHLYQHNVLHLYQQNSRKPIQAERNKLRYFFFIFFFYIFFNKINFGFPRQENQLGFSLQIRK